MASGDDFPPRNTFGAALVQPTGRGKLVLSLRRIQPDGSVREFNEDVYRSVSGLALDSLNSQQVVYEDVQLTAWTMPDSERIQMVQNQVDDGKIWSFGREVRTLSLSIVLPNTHATRDVSTTFWNPRGMQHWREIIERARISALASRRMLVHLTFDLLDVWGGFLESEIRISSSAQKAILISATFLVTEFKTVDAGSPRTVSGFPTTKFNGEVALTREGARVLGETERSLRRTTRRSATIPAFLLPPDRRVEPTAPAPTPR